MRKFTTRNPTPCLLKPSAAYVTRTFCPTNHHKLEFRSDVAIFLGYSPFHKSYKALLSSGKVVITRDILFDENTFPRKLSSSCSSSSLFPMPNPSFSPIIPSSPPHFPSLPPASQLSPITTYPPYPSPPSPVHLSPANAHVDPTPIANTSQPSSSQSPISLDSSTALSFDPSSPVAQPTSSHHMVTRGKAGVFKPRTLYPVALDPSSTVPRSISIALSISVWKVAMAAEFLALLRNKHRHSLYCLSAKTLFGVPRFFGLNDISLDR